MFNSKKIVFLCLVAGQSDAVSSLSTYSRSPILSQCSPVRHYRIDCFRNSQLQQLRVVIPPRDNAPLQAIQFAWGQVTQTRHHLLKILEELNEHLPRIEDA